jgi:hypothetical protein
VTEVVGVFVRLIVRRAFPEFLKFLQEPLGTGNSWFERQSCFGRLNENQQFGDEHGLGLNLELSVEVIKGPTSLLYGSDALGGVYILT